MGKKGYTPEHIINKLREAESLLSQNETITVISRRLGQIPTRAIVGRKSMVPFLLESFALNPQA